MPAGKAFTTSAVGAEMSIKVLRKALPLSEVETTITAASTGETSTPSITSTETASETSASASTFSGASTESLGTIAGIVVASLAFVAFVTVGIYICVWYREEKK